MMTIQFIIFDNFLIVLKEAMGYKNLPSDQHSLLRYFKQNKIKLKKNPNNSDILTLQLKYVSIYLHSALLLKLWFSKICY